MVDKDSFVWAIQCIHKHSDGDLFPRINEFGVFDEKSDELADKLSAIDLAQLEIGSHRRFIVPKDELSYRQATQLDPQDSIVLSAIIYQYGSLIENRRLSKNIVFSYRFHPTLDYGFYQDRNAWNDFWRSAYEKSLPQKTILYCDIADYYNQVYHHTIENQLIESGFPNQVTKWIIRLLESTTAGVSRGIPVGPHAVHMLAEAAMIPIDNSLQAQGIDFVRYVDDILIFCNSEAEARITLSKVATTLDRQQRLMLQRHKTRIYSATDFQNFCSSMIEDRPISKEEDNVLKLINRYSNGDPYTTIFYNDITEEDWVSINDEIITNIIGEYLSQTPIEYDRLRWFYRRLTQIGHPGGIDVTLENIERLTPCFANVCMYLGSVQRIQPEKWKDIGNQTLALLETEVVKTNEYFRLLLLSLFTRNEHINHFSTLIRAYTYSEAFVRREIILSARQNSATDWLREQKENYINMEAWQQMAYIYSISRLPREERNYLINRYSYPRPIMEVLSKWSKKQ